MTRGERLGPYETLEAIGAGGMGEVWKARDTRLDRIVAIKTSKEQFSERFEREARAVAALNHPHICQLYDVGPNYLVMEFIEGAPLKGPLPIEKAVEYAGQILEALDAAHRKGITHRDLKPANILVTKQGIKLLDFGLAKQAGPLQQTDATLTEALTQRGQIVGTLQYMSPEQLQGKEADARSDLFAFGCVLYEMLTGKRAFEGESAASVIAAILEREVAPLTAAPPLERVVRRALAKDPDQRFQSARDLKAALTWAMEQAPPSAAAKARSRWWIAPALVISALGGWVVAHFRQPTDDRVLHLQMVPTEGGRFLFGLNNGGISLSPDGRAAAYVASGNGKNGLWVRPLDGATSRLIAGTEGAAQPFWSPDSKSIAFFAAGKLQRVDLAGGSPLPICDVGSGLGRGGSWGNDGYILFGGLTSGLSRVSASGGTPSPLTTPDKSRGELHHRWPQVFSGGRFLYRILSDTPEITGVYVSSLSNPAERFRLLTTDANAVYAPGVNGKSYVLWQRGGALFAQEYDPETLQLAGEAVQIAESVSVSGNGQMSVAVSATGLLLYNAFSASMRFTWWDRTGKPLGAVGEPPANNFMFRLSPDSRHIAVQRNTAGSSDLWLIEAERGIPNRFTAGTVSNTQPIWSPDGRTILFTHLGSRNLFRKETNGVGEEQLVAERPGNAYPVDWSGDGRWVLTSETAPGANTHLWILPMTQDGKLRDGVQPRQYLHTTFNESHGRFSPEPSPRWVAYQSDESGSYEVYMDAFPEPRGKKRISTAGGSYPQWGADGRELFYVSPDNKLMAVSLKPAGDSLEPSAPRGLFVLPPLLPGINVNPYQATRDGQRFLVLTGDEHTTQPLTVIVNWPALLKKAAGAP
ncbi:MAG: serine/threonine-protein kinase [Acidobacteriia bacterium]|nr:serine/threonine-protein kinase [Terriglobia bacterium]